MLSLVTRDFEVEKTVYYSDNTRTQIPIPPTPPHPQYWIIHNRQLKTQVQNKVMIAEGSAVQKILLGQKVRADT